MVIFIKSLALHYLHSENIKLDEQMSKMTTENRGDKWRSPKMSRITVKTTKARILCYAIIQSPQWLCG